MADEDTRWPVVASGGIVTVVGLVFVTVTTSHLAGEYDDLASAVLGAGIPMAFGFGTVVGGVWLVRSDLTMSQLVRFLAWWATGMVATGTMGLVVILYEQSHGVELADATYVVANNVMGGSVGGLLVGYFYVNARRRADELAAERERLATEHERLEVLNRVVRHDIRNDMTVLLTWLELLEDNVAEEGQDALDRIQTAADHVVELTRVAGEYVAVVVGDNDADLHPVDATTLLRNEVETRREAYPEADFVLDDLPSVTVRANEMLSSVFRNLLNNAVQHNDAETPRVEVDVRPTPNHVVVTIADNGPGIPQDLAETVFGKGESGFGSAGTGIGLYLVKSLVEEYGGTVRVEDNEPRGTIFAVELPRA